MVRNTFDCYMEEAKSCHTIQYDSGDNEAGKILTRMQKWKVLRRGPNCCLKYQAFNLCPI